MARKQKQTRRSAGNAQPKHRESRPRRSWSITVTVANLLVGGGILAAIVGVVLERKWSAIFPCRTAAEITAGIRTMKYSRLPREEVERRGGEVGLVDGDFQFQQIFYDWKMILRTNQKVAKIVVSLDRLQADDRLRIEPVDAKVSDPQPRWVTGFDEPDREADFFARTITFRDVSADPSTAEISVRRALDKPLSVRPESLIHISSVNAPGCSVDLPPSPDVFSSAEGLTRHARLLSRFDGVFGRGELPIVNRPGDVPIGMVESVGEWGCENEACDRYLPHFISRLGSTPSPIRRSTPSR